MAITTTFDPEVLLQPISEEAPCGTDPRADISVTSRYLRVKDARAMARRTERANDVDNDGAPPIQEWSDVVDLSGEILSVEGKDLEVMAWMIEGMVRIDGFSGLYTALKAAEGLVSTFWEGIHPLPDEDGNEARLAPFIGLNGVDGQGTLIQPLRKLPITAGDPAYAFWQYEQANDIVHIADQAKRDARLAAGGLTLDAFTASVQATPASFYSNLVAELEACLEALNALSEAFSVHVGRDAPPAGTIRGVLTGILEAVRVFASDKLAQAAQQNEMHPSQSEAPGEEGAAGATPSGTPAAFGTPSNREDALRQILRIAAYFREHEPHSPISYTLEEIVRRGRMPLAQLLDELIIDHDARRYFYIASGLKAPEVES
ncbi:type VI secretion system protein TssA [Roseixanthobacter glucoisosaccharinicivorans]|uniref:type VI secretion system protein TssA n=1 Tax=Roseixanthobacter glucoisosaccharinicivorans TaxID=3119923 RepID=UPI003726E9AD